MRDSTTAFDVIVVGAGVGGAAFALALARAHDLRVLVIDRHQGPGNINRGESLLPPVTRLLAEWRALDRVRAAGALTVARMQFHHHRAGLLLDVPLTLPGVTDPYLVLPHPEIERVFVEAAAATGRVQMRYGRRVTRIVEDGGRVTGVVLDTPRGGEEEIRARLVVGADGAASKVRGALGIELPRVPYDHALFIVDIDRPPGHPDVLRTELHPDGGILVVPGVNRLGLAALVHARAERLFRSGSPADKLARIVHRSPLLEGRRASPVGVHLYKLWRGHAPRYAARGAVLLGDAIHVINPVMAQGMTMAIEDAAALARHLGPVLASGAGPTDVDRSLDAYERERRPINAGVIRWSHWMSCGFALGGPGADVLHRGVFGLANSSLGRVAQRMVWSRFATSPA
ncbi:MAG TPA: NAD(P)/FAD-dependent oxidoreductase [Methylomirabilota bacterium]|jgi:2-polyprenyl-6-methoxyphenol hydroxylase-like FAD-dependent oxidoreductase|nr:NAD(P)/FAD-dependent oxidoreductase [Methylomirabilota bacterium]